MRKFAVLIGLLAISLPQPSQAEIRTIVFPVAGPNSFSDSFGDPRSGGRTHEGIDIIAAKMTPLLSAVTGRVTFLPQDEPTWGYGIYIEDADDYSYRYLHVNNDTPGTDDGQGGPLYAYAPTITRGADVVAGQLIGWVGDSGNAENVGAHLHFEIRRPDRTPINPYESLLTATQPGAFNPTAVRDAVTTINDDKTLTTVPNILCATNTLLRAPISQAVYYCGADGKRYVFPNSATYASWFANFDSVVKITNDELAAVPLGGNVTYRPGVKMVKIQTDPKVYAVDRGGMLRWVTSPDIAKSMYGTDWAKKIDDVPDAFFSNYKIGEPITAVLN